MMMEFMLCLVSYSRLLMGDEHWEEGGQFSHFSLLTSPFLHGNQRTRLRRGLLLFGREPVGQKDVNWEGGLVGLFLAKR